MRNQSAEKQLSFAFGFLVLARIYMHNAIKMAQFYPIFYSDRGYKIKAVRDKQCRARSDCSSEQSDLALHVCTGQQSKYL